MEFETVEALSKYALKVVKDVQTGRISNATARGFLDAAKLATTQRAVHSISSGHPKGLGVHA